jgi:hypothetical protein
MSSATDSLSSNADAPLTPEDEALELLSRTEATAVPLRELPLAVFIGLAVGLAMYVKEQGFALSTFVGVAIIGCVIAGACVTETWRLNRRLNAVVAVLKARKAG